MSEGDFGGSDPILKGWGGHLGGLESHVGDLESHMWRLVGSSWDSWWSNWAYVVQCWDQDAGKKPK